MFFARSHGTSATGTNVWMFRSRSLTSSSISAISSGSMAKKVSPSQTPFLISSSPNTSPVTAVHVPGLGHLTGAPSSAEIASASSAVSTSGSPLPT